MWRKIGDLDEKQERRVGNLEVGAVHQYGDATARLLNSPSLIARRPPRRGMDTSLGKRDGHRVVAWTRDEGVSGSNGIDGRLGLAEALEAVRERRAEGFGHLPGSTGSHATSCSKSNSCPRY